MLVNLRSVSAPSPGPATDGSGYAAPRYGFSGHQTFPFRYSWLPKGVQAVGEDPEVFSRPDAFVRLGVGKNMAASIRFWCEALGLIRMAGRTSRLDWLGKFVFHPPPPRILEGRAAVI